MNHTPMYRVIYDELAARISNGELSPGEQLPSEVALAGQFGVSRMTVRQALDWLAKDRLLLRRTGAGTFVAPRGHQYRRLNRLSSFVDDIGAGEGSVSTIVHAKECVEPSDDIRRRLQMKNGAAVVRLLRVRVLDATPVALQESWVPYATAPTLVRLELIEGSLYRSLKEYHNIQLRWADQDISAAAANEDQAGWLKVSVGSPLTFVTRTTYSSSSIPVEFAHSWTRPEFPLRLRLEA